VLGWSAVGMSTPAAGFWSYWGILENFHEGWYQRSLWMNLAMMLGQYLLPAILFVGAALTGIRWPKLGGLVHVAAALWAAWYFRGAAALVIYLSIVGPLCLMGAGYAFGRAEPRRRALALVTGAPLILALVFGAEPAYRVLGRLDDADRSAVRLAGNGADLVWAPAGPGWPDDGVPWSEAQRRARFLVEDGSHLAQTPQEIWRLPTVDEAVRSMRRHGENCGGSWDEGRGQARYERTPDKESPLWDVHSKVIYWWTATEVNEREAWIVVYDGKVWPRPKAAHWGYLGFRAVKSPSGSAETR
jgi:hypothetical protein